MRGEVVDDNRSAWLAELPPYEAGPALRGAITADVAIVGGGITGVSTAWHLAERFPSRRIVVLEARALAAGASGRNGGQVLNGINGVEPREREEALRVQAATSAGIDAVEALAGHSTLPCGFVRRGALEVCTTAASAEGGEERARTWASWGLPVRWLGREALGIAGAHGAVLDTSAGRVNCAALVRGLRGPLAARGVTIYEGTPVVRVDEGEPLVLTTPGGTVRAQALVLATNGYTPALGFFRGGVLPLHSHVVATAPLAPEVWGRLGFDGFADDLDRIAYGCRTPGDRLVFGGGSNAAYTYRFAGRPTFDGERPRAGQHFAAIEARMRSYFPALGDAAIEARWSGLLGITFDRVCSMGVGGPRRNVFHALGYSGHGLALGALAGAVIRDLYSDAHEPWQGLPFYQRRLRWIPPEPLRWLGYQVFTRVTGRSPRRR